MLWKAWMKLWELCGRPLCDGEGSVKVYLKAKFFLVGDGPRRERRE